MSLSRGLRGRARAGPWVVLFAACSTLVVSDVAASVPRAVVGAYMAHMGIGFMGEGLETIRRTNDTADKLLVVVVPLLMACNFLSGLLFGLIVSLIKFVIISLGAPIEHRSHAHRRAAVKHGAALDASHVSARVRRRQHPHRLGTRLPDVWIVAPALAGGGCRRRGAQRHHVRGHGKG